MCRTGKPRLAPTAPAFTLVETVVVVVLIAVLSGMAITSLAGSAATAELRIAARQLQQTAQASRAYAAMHATATRLVIDPREGRFLVEKEAADQPGTFEVMRDGVHKPGALPRGVRFGHLDILAEVPGESVVRFDASGEATGAVIEITDERRSFTLRVDAATGRVVLTEGRITEHLSERIDLDA